MTSTPPPVPTAAVPPLSLPSAAAILRAGGLKVTAQRVAVLDVLTRHPHSDAERLHRGAREALSTVTLQSVNNALAALTERGIIRRIEPAGSSALYERRVGDNHHHAVCTRCGSVSDIDCLHGSAPCLTPTDTHGFSVASAEVTFWGLCPECQALASSTDAAVPATAH